MKKLNRIKEVLSEKGIKQTWLAKKIGRSNVIVSFYVQNKRHPNLKMLYKIADVLEIDVRNLLYSTKNK